MELESWDVECGWREIADCPLFTLVARSEDVFVDDDLECWFVVEFVEVSEVCAGCYTRRDS